MSTKPEITIVISGPAGVGKTTIAAVLGQALKAAGLDAWFGYPTAHDLDLRPALQNGQALAEVVERGPSIKITEVRSTTKDA